MNKKHYQCSREWLMRDIKKHLFLVKNLIYENKELLNVLKDFKNAKFKRISRKS